MIWQVKDKEVIIKKCFALLPKRIGDYRIWLSNYYKTWDYYQQGPYEGYVEHCFVHKKDAVKYVEEKRIKYQTM